MADALATARAMKPNQHMSNQGQLHTVRKRRSTTKALRTEPAAHQASTPPDEAASSSRDLARHLGNLIRELRAKDHLTMSDLAAQAGISRGMLSKIQTGQ